jgi:hypothetical protein
MRQVIRDMTFKTAQKFYEQDVLGKWVARGF